MVTHVRVRHTASTHHSRHAWSVGPPTTWVPGPTLITLYCRGVATTVFTIVVLLRFTVPLLIPRFPLPAILACLVLDAADQTIFQAFTDDPLPGYQTYDKALDVYYLAIAYCSSMRNWTDPVAFQTSRFLYLYRLVGVTLFELFNARWLLLVFANTFEYFFIAYEAVRTRWNPLRLSATAVLGMAAFIWIFIKLPQEWWIHIAKLDFTEAMEDHPWMWAVFAVLAVIVGTVGWLKRESIPATDWKFTVDVNDHLPPPAEPTERGPVFSPLLLEKVVFLSLVCVIFAQVLPDIESSNLAVAIGVAIVVVLNALVTEFLYRRGHHWTRILPGFAATIAINLAIVFADSLFVRTGNDTPRLNTLFFVLLVSLLVAMFDVMRSGRGANDGRKPVWAAVRAERAQRAEMATAAN
jgi:hypothetical protein